MNDDLMPMVMTFFLIAMAILTFSILFTYVPGIIAGALWLFLSWFLGRKTKFYNEMFGK